MNSLVFLSLFLVFGSSPQENKALEAHYERWLKEDVAYIITDEEKAVFKNLTSASERDAFIEQFWARRDPDPRTRENEFKEEHYRRIAYVNRRFGSGIPGWKTDRGRIYIAYGEPAEIEDHSAGGTYQRKPYEGGGRTVTLPFQVWRYHHIDGVGDDVEIEFVDRSLTGEYKLTTNPDDKDLLLRIDTQGLTFAEKLGLANKNQRYSLHPGNASNVSDQVKRGMRSKDTPFERMRRFFNLQRPPKIVNKALKSIIETHVSYNLMPFAYSSTYFWMSPDRALVPFTIELKNKELEYQKHAGFYKASVSLYGTVTAINGHTIAEFEDHIASEFSEEISASSREKSSIYQKPLGLGPGTYKLELVVKDLNSGHVGTLATRIHIPSFNDQILMASPILLARQIAPLRRFPESLERFVIGDVKAIPNVEHKFKNSDYLGVYMQAYNPQIDASTQKPAIRVNYRLKQNGAVLTEEVDSDGRSIQFFSLRRVVLVRRLPLKEIPIGQYTLEIEIQDLIASRQVTVTADFEVIP